MKKFIWLFGENLGNTYNNNSYYFWDEALDLVATKFLDIKKNYGTDALAGFACSRSTNEDIYMMQKLVRCGFGNNNVDNCARV